MAVAATAGLSYLKYLSNTWMPMSLWHGWSQKARLQASVILKIPVEGVIPTTNHLEAFNGILKHKHIHRWQCGGRHLRCDLFVFLLITQILPSILNCWTAEQDYYAWLSKRFQDEAGGRDLTAARHSKALETTKPPVTPVEWWSLENQVRHIEEANYMVAHSRVTQVFWVDPSLS